MTLDNTNTDKLAFFKNDLKQMNIEILPPNINYSEVNFSVENQKVRYALSAVKNVGEGGMMQIVAERNLNGPYQSLQDFFTRVDVSALNRRYVENLVKAGAFDCLEKNRAKIFENIDNLLAFALTTTQSKKSAQISLFGITDQAANGLKLREVSDWPNMDKLEKEAQAIGFYLSAHPLDSFDSVLERLRVIPSSEIKETVEIAGPSHIQIAAVISDVRERISQKGKKYAFISANDKHGTIEAVCFSEVLASDRDKLKSGAPLLLSVAANKNPDDEQVRLTVQSVEYLSDVVSRTVSTLLIKVDDVNVIKNIHQVLSDVPAGQGKIFLTIPVRCYEVEIALPNGYLFTPQMIDALQHLPGLIEMREV